MQMVAMPPAVLRGGSRVGRVLSGSYEPRCTWVALAGKLRLYVEPHRRKSLIMPGTMPSERVQRRMGHQAAALDLSQLGSRPPAQSGVRSVVTKMTSTPSTGDPPRMSNCEGGSGPRQGLLDVEGVVAFDNPAAPKRKHQG